MLARPRSIAPSIAPQRSQRPCDNRELSATSSANLGRAASPAEAIQHAGLADGQIGNPTKLSRGTLKSSISLESTLPLASALLSVSPIASATSDMTSTSLSRRTGRQDSRLASASFATSYPSSRACLSSPTRGSMSPKPQHTPSTAEGAILFPAIHHWP